MIRKLLNVAGFVADRALNALAPIELRHMDYLTALNGKPVFDHDSVQLAANKLADEQLAYEEAERDSWEPDELWAAMGRNTYMGGTRESFADTDDFAEPVGEYPDIDCTACTPNTRQAIHNILNEHMYIPVWGHCTCLPRNTAVLGINAWNEHIATIITNKGK